MKQINLFYSEHSEKYIINEKREFTSQVPGENVKKTLEDALKFISDKYPKRKLFLEMKIPEKDQEFVKNYFSDSKNIDYRFK